MATKKAKVQVVKHFPNPKSLSEEYQQTGFNFAFVTAPKDGLAQCHEWVVCRDFLPDAAMAQLSGNPFSIYNFNYTKGENPPIDMSKMRMLVAKKGLADDKAADFKSMIASSLRLVNHYERYAGVPLSTVKQVKLDKPGNVNHVYLFVGPKMWMTSPILISMYTFLLRLGDKKINAKGKKGVTAALKDLNDQLKAGKISDKDAGYLAASWDKMHAVLDHRAKLFPKKDGYHDVNFKTWPTSNFHHNMGIRALCLKQTPDKGLNERMGKILAG
jgi:hypothetical protein